MLEIRSKNCQVGPTSDIDINARTNLLIYSLELLLYDFSKYAGISSIIYINTVRVKPTDYNFKRDTELLDYKELT